jgi:hypothetical protein
MLRLVAALTAVVAFIATGSAGVVRAAAQTQGAKSAGLFITLPMTNGFADATDALVETKGLVHEALGGLETVRLVDRLQESDVVLTVLGRGTGYVELTATLQGLDPSVVAPPVMLHEKERYIEAMLTVGSCGSEATTNATKESKSLSCYRKIVVGLGDHEERQVVPKAARNTWTICANALARDVQAWVTQNASRLVALRG